LQVVIAAAGHKKPVDGTDFEKKALDFSTNGQY
jgi:hypothetical protein